MNALWDSEEWLTPGEVQELIPNGSSLAYTTVTTALMRLRKKGRVERRKVGRAYTYGAVMEREEYAAAQMNELLAAATNHAGVLTRFVDELSTEDRRRLRSVLKRG